MITFSKLEKKGNLGNQLFQIASTIGIAKKNQHEFCFPNWSFQSFFETNLPSFENLKYNDFIENQFHFEPIVLDDKNYDLNGWFQSEKYFDSSLTKHYFQFKKAEVDKIKLKYVSLFTKPVLFISIRRGDFVNHKDYFQLPISYYLNALHTHFPDYKNYNLFVTSDDSAYCNFHFSSLKNVFFGSNISAIEQLIIASLSHDFIISNSTFSWWCAWFGESNSGKIIRPQSNFTLQKNEESNDKDYFPERWIKYDHSDYKINFDSVVFCQTKSNLIIENYVNHHFNFHNKQVILLNELSFNDSELVTKNILVFNDAIVSPIAIYYALLATQITNKSFQYNLIGSFLKTASWLDKKLFSKFWDYGIFTKILAKDANLSKNKIVFLSLSNSDFKNQKSLKLSDFNTTINNLELRFTMAGKIEKLAFRFFIVHHFDLFKRKIKKVIRNFIKKHQK